MDSGLKIEFGVVDEVNEAAQKLVNVWNDKLRQKGTEPNLFVNDIFRDTKVHNGLKEKLGDEELFVWYENTTRFNNMISEERSRRAGGDMSGLLGEEIVIPETVHADGSTRRSEQGYKINLEVVESKGIDTTKVAMFRLTQPSETPKPEYYWTANYFESKRGLQQEVSSEKRKSAVILVSDLKTINENGGTIMDINDSGSLDVRQIGSAGFVQSRALAVLRD